MSEPQHSAVTDDRSTKETIVRTIATILASIFIGWHVWKVFTDHNADKAGVFVLIVIALSALVALYRSNGKD